MCHRNLLNFPVVSPFRDQLNMLGRHYIEYAHMNVILWARADAETAGEDNDNRIKPPAQAMEL